MAEAAASLSPAVAGNSSAMPLSSVSTPAPDIADPMNTGCTRPARLRRASAARNWSPASRWLATKAASTATSCSASRSARSSPDPASSEPKGTKAAAAVPIPWPAPIGTISRVRRRAIVASTRSGSAPGRSSLLIKISVGMPRRLSARISTRVCPCTPSTAETTSTAPSSTFSTRSTSAMKSGWPGVSIRLIVVSWATNDTTAALMVMPR